MKKLILSLLALAVIATTSTATVQAQTAAKTPHRIGVIDMAHVFQNYKKFEALRTDLQAEIVKSDAEAKKMVERLQQMQTEMKKYDAGGPQYETAEKNILDQKGKFDSFRASTQRQLARRESEMFKVIYTDVTAAVTAYAKHAEFDHILRFNRKGIDDTTNPQDAVQTMNKTFIYTTPENDLTDVVLNYLNQQYEKSPGYKPVPAKAVSNSGGTPLRK